MPKFSQAIRKFNRFELKYLISLAQAECFKAALRPYVIQDEHGENGKYSLTSLYYDSPDLRCYWEKEYGLHFRRKLRIRQYDTNKLMTEETPVFLEIKQRVDRVTQKRRVVLSYGDALRLCNDRHLPENTGEDQEILEEMYSFIWQYNLRPISIVRYDRQAFMGTQYDMGLRVTFDTNLTFQVHKLHIHEEPSALPMLSPNQVVMEIKVNERIPTWLTGLIADHNLKLVRVSKYCHSIDTAQKTSSLGWRNLPPESSAEMLAMLPVSVGRTEEKMSITRN
jgi:SPX domain protein involved in polyphosphate accumulation